MYKCTNIEVNDQCHSSSWPQSQFYIFSPPSLAPIRSDRQGSATAIHYAEPTLIYSHSRVSLNDDRLKSRFIAASISNNLLSSFFS